MLTAIAAAVIIPLSAAAADPAAGSAAASWWDVTSGLLLALAGMWATWAQFVYPKLAERRARAAAETPPPPVSATPPAPSVDLVGVVFRDQAARLDDLLDELSSAHRQARRDAGVIARVTAERDEARRLVCPDPDQHHRQEQRT